GATSVVKVRRSAGFHRNGTARFEARSAPVPTLRLFPFVRTVPDAEERVFLKLTSPTSATAIFPDSIDQPRSAPVVLRGDFAMQEEVNAPPDAEQVTLNVCDRTTPSTLMTEPVL